MNFLGILGMGGAPGGSSGGGGMVSTLIMFAMIIGVMYFMVIRPQQKRMKEHKKLLESVDRNDSVTMSGGMHGKVIEVKSGTVLVEIAKNVVVEFEKGSIQSIQKSTS